MPTMRLRNLQNDSSLSSDESEIHGTTPRIPFDANWPLYMRRCWVMNANSGSELFWVLFEGILSDMNGERAK